jgi:hypothetical protein
MDQEQVRELVKEIETRIKEFQASEGYELGVINEYDAIEAVLREKLGG